MLSVVMKACYGVEYVVASNLTEDEAFNLWQYVWNTLIEDEEYRNKLMIRDVVIR